MLPIHYWERKKKKEGFKIVVGLDESGRGALAGPVVAVTVFIKKPQRFHRDFPDIKDSKKISQKKRQEIVKRFKKYPKLKWGIGVVSRSVIDKINILESTKLAMEKAIDELQKKMDEEIDCLLIDGNFKIGTGKEEVSIIRGDETVLPCMVAGIIAKVHRDEIMEKLEFRFPLYGFGKNKGYGTSFHRVAIKRYGYCPAHRKTFTLKGWSFLGGA